MASLGSWLRTPAKSFRSLPITSRAILEIPSKFHLLQKSHNTECVASNGRLWMTLRGYSSSSDPPAKTELEVDDTIETIPGTRARPGSRQLAMVFTCSVCETRSAKQFTEKSYTEGVVMVQCSGCQNWHVLADHLGYFGDGENSYMAADLASAENGVLQMEKLQEILKKPDEPA